MVAGGQKPKTHLRIYNSDMYGDVLGVNRTTLACKNPIVVVVGSNIPCVPGQLLQNDNIRLRPLAVLSRASSLQSLAKVLGCHLP